MPRPECPRTKFPDGTRCGQYGWHASDCPTQQPPDFCVHCKVPVYFNDTIKDQWTHAYGGTYCLDKAGFTATPLQVATPTFHGAEDVL